MSTFELLPLCNAVFWSVRVTCRSAKPPFLVQLDVQDAQAGSYNVCNERKKMSGFFRLDRLLNPHTGMSHYIRPGETGWESQLWRTHIRTHLRGTAGTFVRDVLLRTKHFWAFALDSTRLIAKNIYVVESRWNPFLVFNKCLNRSRQLLSILGHPCKCVTVTDKGR